MFHGAATRLARKVRSVEVARQTTITAIALKRFQLQHGKVPEKLSELVPDFIASVPLDPVAGQPLRYRRNAELYSIGLNGKDDGGNPAKKPGSKLESFDWLNADALDWVWPQPATAAEVQYFYDHPPD